MHEEAKKAFENLLARAATSDQVKSVVLLLKRYESLFQLPSRIRQSIERGEGDQVSSVDDKVMLLCTLTYGMGVCYPRPCKTFADWGKAKI